MTEKTNPYKAWVLTPSYKPKEVEIVSDAAFGYCYTSTGQYKDKSSVKPTKTEAIAFGFAECDRMQADIDKKKASLDKKRAELKKASES